MDIKHEIQKVKVAKRVISISLDSVYIADNIETLSGRRSMLLWDTEQNEWAIVHGFIDFSEDGKSALFNDAPAVVTSRSARQIMKKWLDYSKNWEK